MQDHGRDPRYGVAYYPPGSNPSKAKAKITVSIPVKIGGYTGQRDNWEELERDHKVTVNDDGTVNLQSNIAPYRKVTFDPEALQDALRILRPPSGPVPR